MIDLSVLISRHSSFSRFKPKLALQNVKSAINVMSSVGRLSRAEERSALECIDFSIASNIEQEEIKFYYCSECNFYSLKNQHKHCSYCGTPRLTETSCDYCEECCSQFHYRCMCASHSQNYCRQCKLCPRCCQCERCVDCGTNPMECLSCGCCKEHLGNNGCCHCIPGFPVLYEAEKPSERKSFNSKRKAGVEWEYNRSLIHRPFVDWAKRWHGRIHRDRSCGREAVTPPLAGDYLEKCLTDLNEVFIKTKTTANNLCGIHVHVQADDYNWEDIYKLIKVYTIIEPVLFIIAGQHRLNNNYCVPCKDIFESVFDSIDPKGAILSAVYDKLNGRMYQRKRPGKKDHGRYKALNIIPWLSSRNKPNSTIEFRMHTNTMDLMTVLNWSKLCVKIMDFAYSSSHKEINELPNKPLFVLANLIAKDMKPWVVKSVKNWRSTYRLNKRIINLSKNKYKLNPRNND